jgi:hypothetical protein
MFKYCFGELQVSKNQWAIIIFNLWVAIFIMYGFSVLGVCLLILDNAGWRKM